MTNLKQHQAAMVDLLANGSALSASGARMAHALHDVLALLNDRTEAPVAHTERRAEATTSGLNDAMLALDVAAVRPKKQDTVAQVLKHRENTIRQLKDRVATLTEERNTSRLEVMKLKEDLFDTEQLWRKSERAYIDQNHLLKLEKSTIKDLQSKLDGFTAEQAGCRKEDTQPCGHDWRDTGRELYCKICGAHPSDLEADNLGWIAWRGGEGICPLALDTIVEVKFRGKPDAAGQAGYFAWGHDGHADDIVSYKILDITK